MGDKKTKVGEHFEKVKKGLEDTNKKLKELSGDISGVKSVDVSTIKVVENTIKGAGGVFDKLISSLTKFTGVVYDGSDIGHNDNNAAGGVEKASVDTVITEIKNIIDIAEKSGVKIVSGNAGDKVTAAANTDAPAVLGGHNNHNNNAAAQGAGNKLVAEVSKADPWAIIDKIKNAIAISPATLGAGDSEAGALAAANANANNNNNYGAKTNADLVAAVVLKSIIKGGKFRADNEDAGSIKVAATTAVNKVLGILDVIIKRTVKSNLDKIGEAVKGIKYSESVETETRQSDATQSVVTK
ncbi:Vlp protein, beta subfamily (plasmid) [Borrelia crocidurae str. Achema]|uniref:Variable large protein n=1 Tax=Borrelia crocidurae (strain Achema) TaxID=1155096 RepID=I0FFJ3_BORCA|nr:Vlp protein, beta subfamily [Borrelia crocidurae str. Achema]